MNQKTMKIAWVFFLAVCTAFATVQAQSTYKTALDRGNRALSSRDYEEAIRQFRAAKTFNDAKDSAVRTMLDGKIEEAQSKRITQLVEQKKAEERLRAQAVEEKEKAEEARRRAFELSLRLLTSKVEAEVKATRNLQLGMRLTAFAMRCVDPGNPLFLREFMKSYNASRTAASVYPIPIRWSAKMFFYQGFALSGNAKVFALCSFSKPYLTLFRLGAGGDIVCTDSLDYKPWGISFSPDGNQLAFHTFTPSDRGQVFILRGAGGAAAQRRIDTLRIGTSKQILNMAYYANSPRLAISCKDSILVFDTDKMQRLCALAQSPGTSQLKPLAAHSAKSGNILIETGPEEVVVWDCTPGKIRQQQVLVCPGKIASMQAIWNKNILITGLEAGMLKLWDFTTGAELNSINVDDTEKDPVATIAVTSDGKYIATGLSEGRVAVWELKADHDLELVLELPAQLGGSKSIGLEFLPGTLQLLVAYNDGNALLWDLDPKAVEENLRDKSATLTSGDFPGKVIERLNLYDIFSANADTWGIDSLINSRDIPIMAGFADYLDEKCRNEYNYEEASGYFKQAERLYKALLRLDDSEDARKKLANFYIFWGKIQLYKGQMKEATSSLEQSTRLKGTTDPNETAESRMVGAHIRLLSGQFGSAIQAYNGLLNYSEVRPQEVKNDELVSSFRRLARSNVWAKDRGKQMLVEKALRLIGVPLVADTALANAYGIAPLQTLGMPLGDLIGSIKGADSLTKTQVTRILSLYKHEAKEVLAPRISELSKAGNFDDAGLLAVRQAALFRDIYSAQENFDNKTNLAEALGNVSYYLLFSGQYKTCIRAAEDAFALSGQYWVQTNLAHAYLLSGNKTRAFEIYKDIRDRRDETKRNESKVPPLRDAILSDLETLISKGVRHEAFPAVAALVLDRELTPEERVKYGARN